jgi:flagellar motor switch protein FliM
MTAHSTPQPFDFHELRRLPPRVRSSLLRWQTEACTLVSEAWTSLATYPLRATPGDALPQRTQTALAAAPDPATGVVLRLGPGKLPALLVIQPVLLQAIFADLLGAAAASETAVELTPLEEALLEACLVRLCGALADAWPGDSPLPCAIHELCRPRRTRRLSAVDEVVAITWRVECRFHTGELQWLIPRRELETLLDDVQTPADAPADGPVVLGELVEQFPLEIAVQLGQAALTTAALSRLDLGDVLLLDQPVDKPLTARVNDRPLWLVHPRRVGQRQAIEIHSLLDG